MDLVHQLHSAVEEVQWQHRRLTIAGLSLGGAVALLFYNEYPHMVERLVLAGSGGLDEKKVSLSGLLGPPARALRDVLTRISWATRSYSGGGTGGLLHAARCHATLASAFPDYGVPQDTPRRLREAGIPLSVVVGGLDVVHTPQLRRWASGRRMRFYPSLVDRPKGPVQFQQVPIDKAHKCASVQSDSGVLLSLEDAVHSFHTKRDSATANATSTEIDESDVLRVVLTPWMDHVLLCHGLDWLKLWTYPSLWMDATLYGPTGNGSHEPFLSKL